MILDKRLAQGLQALGLDLPAGAREKLVRFVLLLEKWNRVYNLSAVRDPLEMIPRHLLDSLSILPYVRGPRVLDIGTGAGLPGIPLAVALPQYDFTLLDSNGKKVRFVTQAVHELALGNVHPVQGRIEDFEPGEKFDTLIARAFAPIPDMLARAARLLAPSGRVLAMKGVYPHKELVQLDARWRVEAKALTVPGLAAARHVLILQPRP